MIFDRTVYPYADISNFMMFVCFAGIATCIFYDLMDKILSKYGL